MKHLRGAGLRYLGPQLTLRVGLWLGAGLAFGVGLVAVGGHGPIAAVAGIGLSLSVQVKSTPALLTTSLVTKALSHILSFWYLYIYI